MTHDATQDQAGL